MPASPRSKWKRPCPARRPCFSSFAAPTRTRIHAARRSWLPSTAKRWPARSSGCWPARCGRCSPTIRTAYEVVSLDLARQDRAVFVARAQGRRPVPQASRARPCSPRWTPAGRSGKCLSPSRSSVFGDKLVMLALGGEVVVDYSLRLEARVSADRLDRRRLYERRAVLYPVAPSAP